MNVLVTGGTGFLGRWVVKELLDKNHSVWVLDNLSNSSEKSIEDFRDKLKGIIVGDIRDKELLAELYSRNEFDVCYHLAAEINVQKSIDNPLESIDVNLGGTLNLLELSREYNTKFVFVSSALVYGMVEGKPIDEKHPTKPASPYAASKISAENMVLSYYYTYGMPVTVLRPFSIYGPFQKSNMEGGVISIFIKDEILKEPLSVFGDGTQTRDFLYVEDCAEFVVDAGFNDSTNGQILNAGTGKDISINNLAGLISSDPERVNNVPHHHPQSEIAKMVCDSRKLNRLTGWEPKTSFEDGLKKTKEWIQCNDI